MDTEPGDRITRVRRALVVVVAKVRVVDAEPERWVTRIKGARILIIAARRRVEAVARDDITAVIRTGIFIIADWIIDRRTRRALWSKWVLTFTRLRVTKIERTRITVITLVRWM